MGIRPLIVAMMLLSVASGSAGAKEWEALPQEVQTLGTVSTVWVVGADKGTPVGQGIVNELSQRVNAAGYSDPHFPEQHELGKGQKTGSAAPRFDDVDDARKWLKNGHTVHAAITGGLIGIATAAAKTKVALQAILLVESRLKSGGGGFMSKVAKKAGVPGADKAKGNEIYEYRITLLDEKGQVAWSLLDTADKDTLSKREQEKKEKQTDAMIDQIDAKQKEMAAQPHPEADAAAAKAKADMEAKLTPEQKAQMDAMNSMMPGGKMPAPAMPAGFAKNMMKMTAAAQPKADAGGPERWGALIVGDCWDKAAALLPARK